MIARLLPWAVFAGLVLAMAVLAAFTGRVAVVPLADAVKWESGGPMIRVAEVDVREYRDDSGERNRLTANRATYEYILKTVAGIGVTAYLAEKAVRGTTVAAPAATWDFERSTLSFPEGARLTREGGWEAEVSRSTVDVAEGTLHVPGPAKLTGPGVTASGRGLVWKWGEGKVTMESPRGVILPDAASRNGG